MFSVIFVAVMLLGCFVEPKQVSFDNKVDATNDDIKQREKSNIEHLDNTLRTYLNFAKKCRLCEFPDNFKEFVCKEIQCMTPEQLGKHPIIKRVKSLEPCINYSIIENNCASCTCDPSGQSLDCKITKTVPLCLLNMIT